MNFYEEEKDNIPCSASISHASSLLIIDAGRQQETSVHELGTSHRKSAATRPGDVPTASCRLRTRSEPSPAVQYPLRVPYPGSGVVFEKLVYCYSFIQRDPMHPSPALWPLRGPGMGVSETPLDTGLWSRRRGVPENANGPCTDQP